MKKVRIILALLICFTTIFSFDFIPAAAAATLQYGSSGPEVVQLQKQLASLGFYLGPTGIDGRFGPYTLEALQGVQSASGLPIDGVVGDATRDQIAFWSSQPAFSPYLQTDHFAPWEFKCRHCGSLGRGMSKALLLRLEALYVKLGSVPIWVTSGYRCPVHNSRLSGAAANSQHMYNTAADIQVSVAPAAVANAAETIFGDGGLGRYSSFTHVDVRGYHARW